MTILKNALVCNRDFEFEKTDIVIENEIIKETGITDRDGIDCSGKVILPGFIDIHIHGCAGRDCTDEKPDSLNIMSRYLAEKGVTSFCPTTMSYPAEKLERALKVIKESVGKEEGAYIQGVNLEGPFLSKEKCGAQNPEYIIPPDYELTEKLAGICPVKIVNIAPEAQGAPEFIEKCSKKYLVSIAHTAADYETVKKAEDAGARHATHLYNAMTQLTPRQPGAVGAVFDSDIMTAELICDLIHVSSPALRTAFGILGEDRTVVISDAMMAAGLKEGEYELGGQKVIKTDAARLANGTLAGSTTDLFEEFGNLLKTGIPVKQVIKSLTINPAKCIGEDKNTGSIEPGKFADLIILSGDMSRTENVCIKGRFFQK